MSARVSIAVLLALLAIGTPAAANQAGLSSPMSLDDCISLALAHNTDVLTAQNDLIAAKSRLAGAKSSYLPQLSVQNNTFTWGSGGVLTKSSNGTAFTATQSIYDGGLREANAKSARYNVAGSAAGLSRTRQAIVFEVSKSYYEALRARHLAEVAQLSVTYNEGLRDQVKARAQEGEAARIDVLPVEAQLAAARVSLLSARNAVRTSLIQLQNTIGLAPQNGFDVLDVGDQPVPESAELADYVTAALASRPELLQSEAAVGSAGASLRSARIALYPRPTVSASYQRQVQGGFTSSGSQMVGGIVFDIFDGGANRAAFREAEANKSTALLQQQQVSRDIASQVEEAYLNLTSSRERIVASAASLDAANSNYAAQKERYSQGLGTTLDLLNGEVQVVTAQSDSVQARYDYYTAVAQMDYATGRSGGAK